MAVIEYELLSGTPSGGFVGVIWPNLTAGDTGQPFSYASYIDRTPHVFGEFGGTVTMQGSNDPRVITDEDNASWVTFTNNLGNPAEFNDDGGAVLAEGYQYIRPSAGDGIVLVSIAIANNQA